MPKTDPFNLHIAKNRYFEVLKITNSKISCHPSQDQIKWFYSNFIFFFLSTTHRSSHGGEPTIAPATHTQHMAPTLPSTQILPQQEGGNTQRTLGAGGGGHDDGEDELRFPDEASSGGKAMALMFQAKELQEQVWAGSHLFQVQEMIMMQV